LQYYQYLYYEENSCDADGDKHEDSGVSEVVHDPGQAVKLKPRNRGRKDKVEVHNDARL